MSIYSMINPAMNRLLRSPGHRLMSGRVMTVSYRGRKSRKRYHTPVSYYREGDLVYCFTNGSWRHNFRDSAPARLRLAGRDYDAEGVICSDSHQRQVEIMSSYFKRVPQDRRYYGVKTDASGEPVPAQVEDALARIEIIQFTLS